MNKSAEIELQNKLKEKKFLLEQKNKIIDDYVFITTSDLVGKIVDISQAYLDFTGYKREEVIGKNHSIFRNEKMDSNIIKNLWDTILKDQTWRGELKNHKSSGEEYWISTVIAPLYDSNYIKIGYTSIKQDITYRKILEELATKDSLTAMHNRRFFEHYMKRELKRSIIKKETFALLLIEIDCFKEYNELYGDFKGDKALIEITSKMKKSVGREINDMFRIGDKEFAIVILNREDAFIQKIAASLIEFIASLHIPHAKSNVSDYITISIGAINLYNYLHNINSHDLYNIAENNLNEAKKLGKNRVVFDINEFYVKNLTNIDAITKLPNREALVHDISLLKKEGMLIILHINQIMSLKEIYGFDVVKNLLSKKAKQLEDVLIDGEVSLYSLNLQEFAILVTNQSLFNKYLSLLEYSILLDNIEEDVYKNRGANHIVADFTAGVAYGMHTLFNRADIVLQEAILTKKSYIVYKENQSTRELQEATIERMRVYKNALYTGNIIPYFQPIIDMKDGTIMKYEALARLQTDDGEIVTPYYFLDSAKEDKSFEYFTRQMMQKVFNVYDVKKIPISLNLTYENISSSSMMSYIKNRLDTYGGEGITFEIVESEDIADYAVIEEFILMVKGYGSKVSIDDFGSGYSNFTNVIKLNIDYIKLDGTLIEKLNTDKNVLHMIEGLLTFAKGAKIKTIAEFVSSKELADSVRKLGIDYSQGYYYGEPKSAESYDLI
ncbi:MAG: EAL domain-containing protein [Campylobacterales bacterium]|nr:EAL domain-containing protein [Campylobacterales bacterium]